MLEIRETSAYASWFTSLRDRTAKARIDIRIRRLSLGNLGDTRLVGEGVTELRIHYGPGYRIYLKKQDDSLVILSQAAIRAHKTKIFDSPRILLAISRRHQ